MQNMPLSITNMSIHQIRKAIKEGKVTKEEIDEVLRTIIGSIEHISKKNSWESVLGAFSDSFKSLPRLDDLIAPRVRYAVVTLAKQGWFVSDKTDIFHVFDLVEEKQIDVANRILAKYFRSNQRGIKISLSKAFPRRKQILKQAFRAHSLRQYFLSVPIFLMQADGICFDLLGANFFKKQNRKPVTANIVMNIQSSPYLGAFLEPLRLVLPISEDTRYLDAQGLDFNRHSILHGSSVQYGTEINSLKSISLLHFLSTFPKSNHNIRSATA